MWALIRCLAKSVALASPQSAEDQQVLHSAVSNPFLRHRCMLAIVHAAQAADLCGCSDWMCVYCAQRTAIRAALCRNLCIRCHADRKCLHALSSAKLTARCMVHAANSRSVICRADVHLMHASSSYGLLRPMPSQPNIYRPFHPVYKH
jgi:hypothetical protein